MEKLTAMPNIGKTLADRLIAAGIKTPKRLTELGSANAFIAVKAVYPEACINHLYALEGAVQGIRWHDLSNERKKELKSFFDFVK